MTGDLEHLTFDFRHLLEAELVNFLWAQVGCGHGSNRKLVTRIALGQRPNPQIGASPGSIFGAHKGRKLAVGWRYIILHGGEDRSPQAFLVSLRDTFRKL